MKITFEGNRPPSADTVTTTYQTTASPSRVVSGYALDISGTVTDNTAYGVHGRTAEEVMQAAQATDVLQLRNYMTVMSNSMSEEDFAKLQREGYDPTDTEIKTAVTIVDKIKTEVAKSGVDIVGYTDDIDVDKLAEITGSEAMARELAQTLAKADVPITEENVTEASQAIERGLDLEPLSEGAAKYLITNQMEPTIDNLYMAEHAGADQADRQGKGYFPEELPGYFAKKAEDADVEALTDQLGKVITEAGFTPDKKLVADAKWMVEKGIPVTVESFQIMEQVKEISLPLEAGQIMEAVAGALADGKSAGEANLNDGRSSYEKAVQVTEEYTAKLDSMIQEAVQSENVTARRQLEEIRLIMTVEANRQLLDSGFSIDTAPIEELLNALKQLEQQKQGTDWSILNGTMEEAALYNQTVKEVEALPYMPVAAIGSVFRAKEPFTISSLYETGTSMQEQYVQAGEAYEEMMTEPRRDLGDNIQKAFQNVDDILKDLGYEASRENQRAVRILGYNNMTVDSENLEAVKTAYRQVWDVINKVTPSSVLDMIRDNVNPLDTSLEELNTYLQVQENYSKESTSYSRFLHQLEQNKQITEEEKEAYIGIYRLIRQVEKTDGAVIGSLVNADKQLSFENMLSDIRSKKLSGIDVKINDEFGTLENVLASGVSISAQIEGGYSRELRQEIEIKLPKVEDETLTFIKQLEMPATVDNLLAAQTFKKGSGSIFQTEGLAQETVVSEESVEKLVDSMSDRESTQTAYTDIIELQIGQIKNQTFLLNSSLDVRAMQLLNKQLTIATKAATQEEYRIPVKINGQLTDIHLKLEHSTKESGKVNIQIALSEENKVSGEFYLEGQSIDGYLSFDSRVVEVNQIQSYLTDVADRFTKVAKENGYQVNPIPVVKATGEGAYTSSSKTESPQTKQLYQVAKLFIQSVNGSI